MENSSYISGFKEIGKRLPGAFMIAFTLILVTETAIGLAGPFLEVEPAPYVVGAQLKIAESPMGEKDILIFGDSSAQSALDAKILEKYTRLTCYNFATFRGIGMAGSYFLFDSFLDHNPPPKYVIFMFVHDGWQSEGTYFFEDRVEKLRKEGVIKRGVREPFSLGKFIDSVVPSRRYMLSIRRFVKTCRLSVSILIKHKEKLKNLEEVLRRNNGNYIDFMLKLYDIRDSVDSVMGDMMISESLIANKKFKPSSVNEYFLKKFIERARESNVKIFICFSPLYNGFYNREQNKDYLKAHRLFLRSIAHYNKNVTLLTDDYYVVGPDKLADSIYHLNSKESQVFMRKIADKILEESRHE